MDPDNHNRYESAAEESDKYEVMTVFELTWAEDQVTGVQIELADDQQFEAVQREMLFCGTHFIVSWQDLTIAEDELPAPVLPEVSPSPAPATTGGGGKLTKKERKEQKSEQKALAMKTAIKQEKLAQFTAQLETERGRRSATCSVVPSGDTEPTYIVVATGEEQIPDAIQFAYLTRLPRRPRSRYRRISSAVARWGTPAVHESPERWLVHPGAMAGDLWHIAAAMMLDKRIRLLLAWYRNNEADNGTATALYGLLKSLGVAENRVVACTTPSQATGASLGNADVRKLARPEIEPIVAQHKVGVPLCGHTWASTSILVDHVLYRCREKRMPFGEAVADVQRGVRARYLTACEESAELNKYAKAYEKLCLSWLATLQPDVDYLLVNMRWVGEQGQNPQHNMTERRFAQIVTAASRYRRGKRTLEIIRIGRPETKAEEKFTWLTSKHGGQTTVNIFAEKDPELGPMVNRNKLFQAYFWLKVYEHITDKKQQNNKIVGFVGGRSGSMDIASFLGIRTASFDRVNAADLNYMRLHWAAPFNTIISLVGGDQELLDQGALEAWLLGASLIPVVKDDPTMGTPVQSLSEYATNNLAFDALWFPR